ncbi:carbon catabolite repressor protein 4 homolog 4-like [Diospyros lotus]|uniref:carbon catabolite repressor protein 4 homolog 4-like n=1 Tax=Diospyros lotus TaxID=55363 RepID=UPI00225430AA|nr:carbon catabolite repressor protein 4 homolog 4-like [Diospyros lotus]
MWTNIDTLASGSKEIQPKEDLQLKNANGPCGDPNDPRVRLKRDYVGNMAAFKLKDASSHVNILANTHLCWDPDWADAKLSQAKYLLSRSAQFKTLVADKFQCTPSVMVAGDFNSTPGDKVQHFSCLYSWISTCLSAILVAIGYMFPACHI